MPKENRSSLRPGGRPGSGACQVVTTVLVIICGPQTREDLCLTASLSPLSLLQEAGHERAWGRVRRSFYILIFYNWLIKPLCY